MRAALRTRRVVGQVRPHPPSGDQDLPHLLPRAEPPRGPRCSLTIDSLDETVNGDWFLRVRQGKGRKERIVPLDTGNLRLSDTRREYIRKTRPRDTPQRGLFLSEKKIAGGDYSPLGVNGIGRLFKRLSAATGFDAHPHRCRHHFATRALPAGLDAESLRRSLGHTTLAMTMRSISASDDDLIQAWTRRRD